MLTESRPSLFAAFLALISGLTFCMTPRTTQAQTAGPATVLYIGGNDLLVQTPDKKVLNFTVPDGTKFTAGSKELTLAQLTPGTVLTQPIAGAPTPQVITAIKVFKAKVYATSPPDTITLLTSDGAKDFLVPAGTTFLVGGTRTSLSKIQPDNVVEATAVTPAADGAPAAAAPATPPMSGALLVAKAEELPLAGTTLPEYGAAGRVLSLLGGELLASRRPVRS